MPTAAPGVARIGCWRQADRAREDYQAAESLIPLINEDSQPALWVLITIYRRLLEKIASRQVRRLHERVGLTRPRKAHHPGKGIREAPGLMTARRAQIPSVAIVGGGFARDWPPDARSAESGFQVTIFERRPYLGGRASSYQHPGTGEVVDNCQHVLLGLLHKPD